MLKRVEGPVSEAIFEILRKLDAQFSLDLQSVHRCQFCRMCLLEGKYGYFLLKEGIRMKSANVRCSRLKHSVDKSLYEIMEKPFRSEVSEEPDIKTSMLEGKLYRGEQICLAVLTIYLPLVSK